MSKSDLGQSMMMEKMKDNSEPEEDRGLGTDYSVGEAEQMGAFVEDALSFEDVREHQRPAWKTQIAKLDGCAHEADPYIIVRLRLYCSLKSGIGQSRV